MTILPFLIRYKLVQVILDGLFALGIANYLNIC